MDLRWGGSRLDLHEEREFLSFVFCRDFFKHERRFLRDVFVPHKTEKNVRFLPTRGHTARYAPTAPPSGSFGYVKSLKRLRAEAHRAV